MRRALLIAGCLLLALVFTLVVFGVDPIQGLKLLFDGALGDKFGFARTCVRSTPLILCGLGMAVAWKAGIYNIGGEGQYLAGGLCGAAVAKVLIQSSMVTFQSAVLLGAVVGGGSLALLAGWLQVKRGVQAVISTILLNFIVIQAVGWAVRGPLQESKKQLPQTQDLAASQMFWRINPQTDLHLGVALALLVCGIVAVWMALTKSGFVLKVVGENPRLARTHRIDPGRIQLVAMAVSGALCGFAGGVDYLGLVGHIGDGFSQGWGFLAIPVALLGGLDPIGVVASGAYFGALMAGGESLSRFTAIGTTLVYVIQAVAVLGLVALGQIRKPIEAHHD